MATPRPKPVTETPAERLLAWYGRHARALPWRVAPGKATLPDPYRVWLSEVMLQQTTVKTVAPYFADFLTRWPTVTDLAAAPEEAVMSAWAGLGYYSRARNLHACARAVAANGGTFPDTVEGLLALPGIGPYTAAAIAAIAFGRRAVVVDGNVERVAARYFAIETPLPAAKKEIAEALDTIVPDDRPGDFAQAMMDLGATLCSPRKPACSLCPWAEDCVAHARGIAETLPVKAPKKARPLRRGAAFWLMDAQDRVLLRTRPPKGLLGGMDEVPTTDWKEGEAGEAAWHAAAPLDIAWVRLPGLVTHGFTHFELELAVFTATIPVREAAKAEGDWVHRDALHARALPTVMRKVVAHADPEAAKQFRKKR